MLFHFQSMFRPCYTDTTIFFFFSIGEREVLDIAVGAEPEGEPALPSPALEVVQPSTSSQPSGLQAAGQFSNS